MGRRVFAPFDQEMTNPGSMGKDCGGHGFSWSNTRVDPTRVGVGQFSIPGPPGTNLHTMSRVLLWCCVSFLVLAGNSVWCYVRT